MSTHHTVDVVVKTSGEWHSITYLTDAHTGSSACDYDLLLATIDERRKMPGHRFIIGGDLGDWIVHGDSKRFVPSMTRAELRGKDSVAMSVIKEQAAMLKGCVVDLVHPGNHEDEFLKRHHFDPTHALCAAVGAARGDYEGCIDYSVRYAGGYRGVRGTQRGLVRVIYHHGAWGGGVGGGIPPGFVRWADQHEGWRFAVSGHNHRSAVDKQVRRDYRGGVEVSRPCHYVVAGTGYRSGHQEPDACAPYETRRGFRAVSTGWPLLQWQMVRRHGGDEIVTRVIS